MMERLFRTEVKPYCGTIDTLLFMCTGRDVKRSRLDDGWYAFDVITDIYGYEDFKRKVVGFVNLKGLGIRYDVFNKQEQPS